MPEHDCGAGCGCDNCTGCVRFGKRCIVVPVRAAKATDSPLEFASIKEKLSLNEEITINFTEVKVADAALLISKLLREPIAVPVDRLNKTVKVKMKNKPLSEVIERLGLVKLTPKKAAARRG